MGCGVDLENRRVYFTLDGKKIGFEFPGVSGRLFPILGLGQKVKLETNFGAKPFMYKNANSIDQQLAADTGAVDDVTGLDAPKASSVQP